MSRKVTVIGAGKVGATIAYTLSLGDIASEIVLIDINKEKVEGEVMDIVQGTSFREPIPSSQAITRMRRILTSSLLPPVLAASPARPGSIWHRQM